MKHLAWIAGWLLLAAPLRHLDARTQVPFTRTWTRSFPVNGSENLSLETQYGHVNLHAWSKNTIQVQAVITGYGHDAAQAREMASRVSVHSIQNGPSLDISTSYSHMQRSFWKSFFSWGNSLAAGRQYVRVDYDIYVPGNLAGFTLKGNYVDAFLAALQARISCQLNYGSLNAQDQRGSLELHCNYTHVQFSALSKLDVQSTYSSLQAQQVGQASLDAQYCHILLERAGEVSFRGNYGSFKAGDVDRLDAQSNYTNYEFKHIDRSVTMKTTYADVQLGSLGNQIENVQLRGVYSKYHLEVPLSRNIHWTVSCTYGRFSCDPRLKFREQDRNRQGGILNLNAQSGQASEPQSSINLNGTYTDFDIATQN